MRTWVFLRGLVREQGHWGNFLEQFESHIAHAHALPLDIAGNGHRHTAQSSASIAAMVEDCRAQLAARAVAPPYCVMAISMGGMVAAQWASMYPQELEAMVLINTSMRPWSRFYERLRPRNYLRLLGLLLGRASALEWERSILKMTTRRAHSDVIPHWVALRQSHPVHWRNAIRQLWAALRFRCSPGALSVPTLVLASEGDQLVDVRCSHAIAAHGKATLVVHPWAGHDLPLDDGVWVIGCVRRWLLELHH